MKRAIALTAMLLLLAVSAGCVPAKEPAGSPGSTPAPSTGWSLDSLPRLDGSTANIPLAALLLQRLLGVTEEEADRLIDFSTTPDAYRELIARNADLLLVYEADSLIKEVIAQSGVELEYHPIGRDALVFLTNAKNPVSSLTTQQIQDIYQGNITNWKAVGGEDMAIEAYQRPDTSGSQALMVKLVMKSLPLMNAPTDRYPHEMSGLVDVLGNYTNTANALGYSVYYYISQMYGSPDLKLLGVDGVKPDKATIADGRYPFVNDFYAVIRKEEPQDGKTRRLLNWLLSEDGRQTIKDAGYVSLP